MKVETKFFETIEIQEEQIIHFKKPILGFENELEYILIDIEDNDQLRCLQSIKTKNLCFILSNPWEFYPNYEFDLNEQYKELLTIKESSNVEVHCITNIPGDITRATLNLLAPIVINLDNYHSVQCVLEKSNYQTKHPLVY